MPSTWGLRRRPSGHDEEDPDVLQERYAARLEELLRPPTGSAPGDEADEAAEPAGPADGREPRDPRVGLKIEPRPPIHVTGEDGESATGTPPGEASPEQTTGSRRAGRSRRARADGTPAGAAPVGTASGKSGSRTRSDGSGARKTAARGKGSTHGTGRGATKPAKTATRTPPAACPYCAMLLEPPPRSSGRCTRCRQRIVVKRAGTRLVLLTEAAVPVFEAERRRSIEHGRRAGARDRWLRLARTAGAPEERLRRLGSGLASDSSVKAARALYLASVDRAFRAARTDRHWELAERIRRDEAAVLFRLAGRPSPPPEDILALYREGVSARLRGIAEVAREAELRGAACCAACAADDGRLFRVATERRERRLPHAGCPDGLCRCRWMLAGKDAAALRRLMVPRPRSSPAADPGARPPHEAGDGPGPGD